MIITIQRTFQCATFITGNLFLADKKIPLCQTLERSLSDQNHPAIPEGIYSISRYQSPHNGKCLLVHNVPGRTAIEIHIANFPEELEGCIAVGTTDNLTLGSVHNSRETLRRLMEAVPTTASLLIKNAKPNTAIQPSPYSV